MESDGNLSVAELEEIASQLSLGRKLWVESTYETLEAKHLDQEKIIEQVLKVSDVNNYGVDRRHVEVVLELRRIKEEGEPVKEEIGSKKGILTRVISLVTIVVVVILAAAMYTIFFVEKEPPHKPTEHSDEQLQSYIDRCRKQTITSYTDCMNGVMDRLMKERRGPRDRI